MPVQNGDNGAGDRLKVFVSYSRADIDFADQLVLALEDKGFDPLLDRHDIDAAEKWKERLGTLIFGCDTVVFVLSETSAKSPICAWEVGEAAKLGKRMIPVVHGPVEGVAPPPQLTELNYIHFYAAPAIPGSGFYDGVQKLTRALKVDLGWLRQQTRLSEQAAEWARTRSDDLLLRGVALEEALAWRTRTPKGAQLVDDVRAYLAACEAAGEQRKAEAAAQIAERESALAEKETAVAAKARADARARRATWIGGGVAALLITLAIILTSMTTRATLALGETRANLLADEANAQSEAGQHANAMLIALAGDPAAQRNWFARMMAPDGHHEARAALSGAYTHNTLVRVFEHEGAVNSVAFSPDGARVLTTSSGNSTSWLWDVETRRKLRSFEGHEGPVNFAAFSPNDDGARVVTASDDGTARLWDAETGRELQRFLGHTDGLTSVAFSADGARVLTGAADDTARLWDVETGEEIQKFEHTSTVWSVALSPDPDGARVLTGSADDIARLWDARTGLEIRPFSGHQGTVTSIAFSPDGSRILTGSVDNSARLWNVETGDPIRRFAHSDNVYHVAFSPNDNGARILTGSTDSIARLWDINTGREIRRFVGHTDSVYHVAFSSNGARVLTGSGDGTVRLWDLVPRREVQRFEGGVGAAFSPNDNGARVLTGLMDNTARLWNAETRREIQRFPHPSQVWSIAFSPEGERVLTGSFDGLARLWDADTGQERLRFEGHTQGVFSIAFSPDGARVLTGSSDNTARLWDAETGEEIRRFGHDAMVSSVAFSPDGARVLTGSYGLARLWDAKTGDEIRSFVHEDSRSIASSVSSVAFSPDDNGARVLTGANDGTARLWNTENGQEIRSFKAHSRQRPLGSLGVAFSPDGARILTGSDDGLGSRWSDGVAWLWDTQTGQLIQSFEGHAMEVSSVAFSPDGARVLTSSHDSTARLWVIDPIVFASADEQVRLACDRLRAIGMTRYSENQSRRFPALAQRTEPCPEPRRGR